MKEIITTSIDCHQSSIRDYYEAIKNIALQYNIQILRIKNPQNLSNDERKSIEASCHFFGINICWVLPYPNVDFLEYQSICTSVFEFSVHQNELEEARKYLRPNTLFPQKKNSILALNFIFSQDLQKNDYDFLSLDWGLIKLQPTKNLSLTSQNTLFDFIHRSNQNIRLYNHVFCEVPENVRKHISIEKLWPYKEVDSQSIFDQNLSSLDHIEEIHHIRSKHLRWIKKYKSIILENIDSRIDHWMSVYYKLIQIPGFSFFGKIQSTVQTWISRSNDVLVSYYQSMGQSKECRPCTFKDICSQNKPMHQAQKSLEGQNERAEIIDNALSSILDLCKTQDTKDFFSLSGQEISSREYKAENCSYDKMNGSIEWQSMRKVLRYSSPLPILSTPFSLSLTFSGSARSYGFLINKRPILIKPHKSQHHIQISIDAQGFLSIERDQQKVPWKDFDGFPPLKIGGIDEIRLAAHSIHRSLITQSLLLKNYTAQAKNTDKSYSIVVCCTKYSRRLSHLIRSIALQNYDQKKIEIVIAFVPGLDTTEDIIDGAMLCWKDLDIVPLSFPETLSTHKWKMINRGISASHGKKIIVTDADMIFPPDLLQIIDRDHPGLVFLGAQGRKMLSPETTAKVLHGLIDPVDNFYSLIEEPDGELRLGEAKGKPVGYFQCFKREVFDKVQYRDLPHFEGSDGFFAEDVEKEFRSTVIGKNIILLHLDHQGSKWYGTQKQF